MADHSLCRTVPLFEPVLLSLRCTDGQIDFIHLGVDDDVLQNKSATSNGGPKKLFCSHLGSFFHDSLCNNVIIVAFPLLPRVCSVWAIFECRFEYQMEKIRVVLMEQVRTDAG